MFDFIRRMRGKNGASAPEDNRAITPENRKKAAMALNLCTASISRIIDSQSLDVMELEYDTILNNLNLQNIIKDEPLLTTMRSILDTISFYRIQAGDRKRMEARYQQKMNNALWDGLGKVNVLMFGAEPWTAAAMVAIQVGSAYCSVRRSKSQAKIELDDETWKLERSAMEQLHALRCSLFETAWRLADAYDFEDSWRLTTRQINQYNSILTEPDPAWRYAKLEQYHEDFEAYPYYWFELAEAAFQASQLSPENRIAFLDRAESALSTFEKTDLQLLRQDVISASARLRHVQLLHEKLGSWCKAIEQTKDALAPLRKLACDSPDLLFNGAICYAAAYEESHKDSYAEKAVTAFEMLVNRNYNLPTASRLLSKLYLQLKRNDEYKLLASRVGDNAVLADGEDFDAMLRPDRDALLDECKPLLERQISAALKLGFPDLFNCSDADGIEHLRTWLTAKRNKLDKTVQDDMKKMWETLKGLLNAQMLSLCQIFGVEQSRIAEVAAKLDARINEEIGRYSSSWLEKYFSAPNCIIEQMKAYDSLLNLLKSEYVSAFADLIEKTYSNEKYADITNLENAVGGLKEHLARLFEKHGLIDGNDRAGDAAPVDFFTMSIDLAKEKLTLEELKSSPAVIQRFVEEKKSFEITDLSPVEIFSWAGKISRELERCGQKVRVYTRGREVLTIGLSCSPLAAVGVGLFVADRIHELCTYDPDYEIIRYPNKLVIQYTRNDVAPEDRRNATEEDLEKMLTEAKAQVGRVIDKAKGIFKRDDKGKEGGAGE